MRAVMEWIEKIDHVGIAVKDYQVAHAFFTSVLGAKLLMKMDWEDYTFVTYALGNASMLELIFAKSEDNFINRFIEKRGEGVHHITLKVRDLREAVNHPRSLGIEPFGINDSNPLWKEAFIHPRDAHGVLIQLAEYPEEEWAKALEPGSGG